MGRIILADENIQAYVERLLRSESWYLGLVIGKLTAQKDYAVLMVRTPEPSEDKASEDDDEESSNTNKKPPRRKSQTKPPSLEDLNDQWAATHAKQVTMMLPGGLAVIGIFVVAPPAMMQSAQAKLRQVLFAIQKQEKKSHVSDSSDNIGDRILLQICTKTRKYTCRTVDVQDPKSTFRPADWKFQSGGDWNRLETTMALHVPINISKKSQRSNLAKQIQNGLEPFCKDLWTSLVLIDGNMREETQLLNQSADRKGKSRNTGDKSTFKCNILLKHDSEGEVRDPSVIECSTRLVLKGTIHGRAYVTGKATVLDAQNAMRVDLIRSVLSRCELLCDDIQMVEEDAESEEAYSTPRRVFFTLPGTSLQLCDYMFQDEKLSEVKVRVQELLDLTLAEDDLELSNERPATDEDYVQLCSEGSEANVDISDTENTRPGLKYYLVAGIGGAIAFLGAGLAYILSQDS